MKAFTLVETMVAIAIIMVSILGPFEQIQHALTAAYVARDELIGNSLAQEGVEYVRSIRDGNYLYNRANPLAVPQRWFMDGLDGTTGSNGYTGTMLVNCFGSNSCVVDPQAAIVTQCSGNCPALYTDTTSGPPSYLYNQRSVGVASRFTRSIQLCYMTGSSCAASPISNEARVTVTVTWATEGQTYSTSIVEYLQQWL